MVLFGFVVIFFCVWIIYNWLIDLLNFFLVLKFVLEVKVFRVELDLLNGVLIMVYGVVEFLIVMKGDSWIFYGIGRYVVEYYNVGLFECSVFLNV